MLLTGWRQAQAQRCVCARCWSSFFEISSFLYFKRMSWMPWNMLVMRSYGDERRWGRLFNNVGWDEVDRIGVPFDQTGRVEEKNDRWRKRKRRNADGRHANWEKLDRSRQKKMNQDLAFTSSLSCRRVVKKTQEVYKNGIYEVSRANSQQLLLGSE